MILTEPLIHPTLASAALILTLPALEEPKGPPLNPEVRLRLPESVSKDKPPLDLPVIVVPPTFMLPPIPTPPTTTNAPVVVAAELAVDLIVTAPSVSAMNNLDTAAVCRSNPFAAPSLVILVLEMPPNVTY